MCRTLNIRNTVVFRCEAQLGGIQAVETRTPRHAHSGPFQTFPYMSDAAMVSICPRPQSSSLCMLRLTVSDFFLTQFETKSFMSLETAVQIMHFHIRASLPHDPKFIFALSKLVNSSGQVDFALGIYSWESELKCTPLYLECMHYYVIIIVASAAQYASVEPRMKNIVSSTVHQFELFENVLSKMLECSKGTQTDVVIINLFCQKYCVLSEEILGALGFEKSS